MIVLNVGSYILFIKRKLNLIFSGIMMMILAPVIGYSSGALFLYFYDWSSGGTGEGAGYGGVILGLITIANGILVIFVGIKWWIISPFRKGN